MNPKLNKDEDMENKIASNLAVIANESKTILMAINDLKKMVENSKESERKDTLSKGYEDFKKDLGDNIERIKNAEKLLPESSPPRFQWAIAEIRDPVTEALKIFKKPPPKEEISIEWFNELADMFKKVHSISGRRFVLTTFNEVVVKDRKPGWSIKLHEFLQRYLLYREDRDMVIDEINSRDNINAFVDDRNDILYVIAGGIRPWLRGVGSLLLIFFIGFIIPLLIINGIIPIDVPESIYDEKIPETYWNIFYLYILCWGGFALHIFVKSRDARKENPCLDDIVLWIHIKESGFRMSALAVIVGYIVLLGIGELNFASAFVSGFAVDSFGARIIHQYYSKLEEAAKALEEKEIKLELPISLEREQ